MAGATNEDLVSLIVRVSGDVSKIQKDMAKVPGFAAKAAGDTERAWVGANNNIAASTTRAMQQVQRSTRATQAQTANVAAQFQDIAVQLQSGTSPITIALQQGSQLGPIFAQAAQQGGNAIGVLAGALRGLLSFSTILPIAIIAIGGALIQSMGAGKKSVEDTIKDLKSLKDIADATGADALRIRVGLEIDEAQAKQVAEQLKTLMEAEFDKLGGGKSIGARIVNSIQDALGKVVIDLSGKPIDNLSIAVNNLINISRDLPRTAAQTRQLGDAYDELTKAIAAKDIDRIGKAFEALGKIDLAGDLPTADVQEFFRLFEAAGPEVQAIVKRLQELKPAADNAAKATDGAKERQKEFNDAMQKLQQIGKPAIDATTEAILQYNAAVRAAGTDTAKLADAQAALNVAFANISAESWKAIDQQITSTTSSADDFAKVVAGVEGTGQNPNSTAKGHFQFIASTWLSYVREMKIAAGATSEELLALRDNAQISRAVFDKFTADNVAGLHAVGLEANNLNKYLAHFLGLGDAIKLLKAPSGAIIDNVISENAIRANKEFLKTGSTVAQTIERINRTVESRRQRFAPTANEDLLETSRQSIAVTKEEIAIEQNASLTDVQRAGSIAALRKEKELLAGLTKDGHAPNEQELADVKSQTQAAYDNAAAVEQERVNKNNLKIMNGLLKNSTKDLNKDLEQQAQQFAQFGTQFITTFTSGLRQGKSAVDSLKDALVNLADQLLSMALNAALKSAFTSIFPKGILAGSLASGGRVGSAGVKKRVNPLLFAGAPSMATGGIAGGIPTILHKGEVVIPANMVRKAMRLPSGAASGSQTTNVGDVNIATNVQGTGDVRADTQAGRQLGLQIKSAVTQILQLESRPGGLLTAGGSGSRVGR